MSTSKPTKGPWSAWAQGATCVKQSITGPSAAISHCARYAIDHSPIVDKFYAVVATAEKKTPCLALGESQEEADAHAIFIAESGTVYHETGLTPRELLAQRDELRVALSQLVKVNDDWNAAVQNIMGRPPGWNDSYLNAARAAIAKTKEPK